MVTKRRKSRVSKQRERWELGGKLSEINYALPAVEYTDKHVLGMIAHDLSCLDQIFFLNLLGNMGADTGVVHGYRISRLAERLGCSTSCFYGKDNLIDTINATGMATLYIKNKKVHGRIHEPPKKRTKNLKNEPPIYPLAVSMTHRICLQGLLSRTEAKTVIRILLMLSMHCDLDTGEINTEQRACEWAEMIGVCRTSVERAIDWLTENGFAQLDRDYVVTGRLNYTAMARGFLRKHAEDQKELNAKKKTERLAREKSGLPEKPDAVDIELKLYKFYGLNARGWMRSHLKEAAKYLLKGIVPDPQYNLIGQL